MLAERRTKANYVLNPKNNAWAADESNLGRKLMEKMGWSDGKGLGRTEQGDTEHIRVGYKNDNKGMGYSGPVEDPVLHQNDFADLLAKLNETQGLAAPVETEVSSLEKRSETSKARVHYKKFTRGKDLSRYSAKDLECIIGTGKRKEKPKDEPVVKAEVGSEEHSHGVDTVAGGLMGEYFKKKMLEKRLKKEAVKTEKDEDSGSKSDEDVTTFGFGFTGFKMNDDVKDECVEAPEEVVEKKKKNKKKKLQKALDNSEDALCSNEEAKEDLPTLDESPENVTKSKKQKKKKIAVEVELEDPETSQQLIEETNVKRKKKKKVCEDNAIPEDEKVEETDKVVKKLGKNKRKKDPLANLESCPTEETESNECEKKKKKRKRNKNLPIAEEVTAETEVELSEPSLKKRKKDKLIVAACDEENASIVKSKKKKRSKKQA